MTKHYELHALYTAHDVTAAAQAGLPDTSHTSACSHCGDSLLSEGTFIPRAVVLDGEREAVLCLDCAKPVTAPRGTRLHFR